MADKTDKKASKNNKETTAKDNKNLSLDEQLIAKREELRVAKMGLGSTLQNPHQPRFRACRFRVGTGPICRPTKGDK